MVSWVSDKIRTLKVTEQTAQDLEDEYIQEIKKITALYYQKGMTWYWQQACLSAVMQEGWDE